MTRNNKKLIIAILLITFMVSCTFTTENNFPEIDIPIAEMNKAFIVEDPPVLANSHKNKELLILQLRNTSDTRITLLDSYGVKIFKKENQDWIPVENNLGYSSGEVILLTSKEFPPGLNPGVIPFIADMKQSETIRVVFVGHYDSPEAKKVGAYIELTLIP